MYTKNLLLDKIRQVNEVYMRYKAKGEQNEFIYQNYIRDQFHISRSTFYSYLTINYKAEQKKVIPQNPT